MSNSVNAEATAAFNEAVNPNPVVANSGVDAPTTSIQTEVPVANLNGNKFYTEDDLARVRSQEKDKLYPQINSLKEELDVIKREREEELARKIAEKESLEAQHAEEARRKQEEELELRDLLKVKETEWSEQLERERQERERAFALLEREKAFAELTSYRNQRITEESENILPELQELIVGNTAEEIEASIQGLKAKTSSIMDNVQQATQAARRDMTGTRVTTPPNAGPMDIETGTRQFTAEDINSMSLNDYAKYRSQLLSPSAQGQSKGFFG
jgi:hypothetical protein